MERYVFTFGSGQEHAGHYVIFEGSYEEARQKMFDKYGDKWAFQYPEEEFNRLQEELPPYFRETLLEEEDETKEQ